MGLAVGCQVGSCKCRDAECACGSSSDPLGGWPQGNVQLCSWNEEEISNMGEDPMVVQELDDLRAVQRRTSPDSDDHATREGLPSLFRPSVLVPLHVLGFGGPTLTDVYEIESTRLGRGTYGEVFVATHRRTRAVRAVKSVEKAGLRRYVKDVSAFVRREVDILRRTDHPNIVRLYEAFETETVVHLVLEMCEGGDMLERVTVARERLPEHEAATIFAQMLGAVQHLYLHGVVHRDLKPENFLFSRREPAREPLPPLAAPLKLIDFGLSRRLSFEAGMCMTPKIGTTEYMAPEAFTGQVNAVLADRTDVWSMGVMLHVIFIGHFPAPGLMGQTPEAYLSRHCWREVSRAGRDLLAQLLRPDPMQRPTVTSALRHPWLAAAFRPHNVALLTTLPAAIRCFAAGPDLRRLALAAAAREADDCSLLSLRRLCQTLDLECLGVRTRPALQCVAGSKSTSAPVAAALLEAFEAMTLHGTGVIGWTELVAAALCAGGNAATATGLPPLSDETIWRAFDILGQGEGSVSCASLSRLLCLPEAGTAWSAGGGASGGTGGPFDGEGELAEELNLVVSEAGCGDALDATSFAALVRGDRGGGWSDFGV